VDADRGTCGAADFCWPGGGGARGSAGIQYFYGPSLGGVAVRPTHAGSRRQARGMKPGSPKIDPTKTGCALPGVNSSAAPCSP
jgi:hypothetical protein